MPKIVSWGIGDQHNPDSVRDTLETIIRDHSPICICLQHVRIPITVNDRYTILKTADGDDSLVTLYLPDSLIRMTHLYAGSAPFQMFRFKPNFTVFNVAPMDDVKHSTTMIRIACEDFPNIIMFGDVGSMGSDTESGLVLHEYRGRGIECFVPFMEDCHNERPYEALQGINVVSFG